MRGLVLELVEGETLAERLARGPVSARDALTIARQIADALDAAHEKGIIHRDLKPANIKITPAGTVKVLDFGLGKAATGNGSHPDLSQQPTVDGRRHARGDDSRNRGLHESGAGARPGGRQAHRHLGVRCVLYEMLTGHAAFARATMSDTIAAVLTSEPDWTALPPATPPQLSHVLRRCLEKDPARRQRDIGDARVELDETRETSPTRPGPTRGWARTRLHVGGVGPRHWRDCCRTCCSSTEPVAHRLRPSLSAGVLEQLTFDAGLTAMPALSPDGKLLAYASDRAGRGDLDIWVQQAAGGAPVRLTEDPTDDQAPSFSPDGSQIVFRSERDGGGLYVIPSLGGDARRIARDGRSPRFSPDGKQIAYWTGSVAWRGEQSGRTRCTCRRWRAASRYGCCRISPVRGSLSGLRMAARSFVVGRRDRTSPLADAFDLWFVPLDGRPPAKTGAFDLRESAHRDGRVRRVDACPGTVDGGRHPVVIAARTLVDSPLGRVRSCERLAESR